MTEHITDLSDLNRARVYLYGSLREKGFAAKDIDLIVVGVGTTEDFNNLDTWADIAYETEKCLDVWLLAPDWGRYACDHHGWSGWGSDLTPADITAGVNSYLGSMAWKILFDPETGEWSFNACVAETGFFGHVDFSAEITPEEVLRLCASRLPVSLRKSCDGGCGVLRGRRLRHAGRGAWICR
jgi:hypothetical protein